MVVGESLARLGRYLPRQIEKPFIITDETVYSLYGNLFPDAHILVIGKGEGIKTLETVSGLYDRLIQLGADRSSYIVGIGGGVVCDISGFTASTYMRGVGFGFAATTLLAQVDASVGGKNGVNFRGYKNMVGVFSQPDFVICDPGVLSTLEKADILCGFAEIIKHAAIADKGYFRFLEENREKALALDPEVLSGIISASVQIKSGIVNQDETEKGIRKLLNFGHTMGHALEKVYGIPHGYAVAQGMAYASGLSVQKGMLKKKDHERLVRLIRAYGFPEPLEEPDQKVWDALGKDKKKHGENLDFVLLERIGKAGVVPLPISECKTSPGLKA